MKFFYLLIAVGLFLVGADYLLEIKPKTTPDNYANWGLGLLAVNLFPGVHYIIYRRKNIPFIPLTGIYYALSFPLPLFFIDIRYYQLGALDIRALQYGFWGLLLFYLSYYVAFEIFKRAKPFAPVKDLFADNVRFIKILMWTFLALSVVGKLAPASALRHFYDPSVYISAGLFMLLLLKRKLGVVVIVIVTSYIMFEFATRFAVTLMASSARYMLFLSIIYYLIRRRIPYLGIIAGAVLYSLLLPVKFEFRRQVTLVEGDMSTQERIELFYELAREHYIEKQKTTYVYGEQDEESPFLRFSYSASAFSKVIEMTPGIVPYWGGYTYSTLYSKFIPRFLWPGKPVENIGQEFGHRYHILDDDDEITSMNMPWLAELFANYGENAVYFGMALFGLLFGFIDRFYNSGANVVNIIISSAIYFPIITHESNFALEAGNMVLLTVAIYFFVSFVQQNVAVGRTASTTNTE